MSRKSFCLTLGALALLAGAAVGILLLLVCREPAAYARTAVPPGAERERLAKECLADFTHVINVVQSPGDWSADFTDEEINSYFQEDFVGCGLGNTVLPEGFSEPRVTFGPDTVQVAFRYGCGAWSTIISIDLRVWLASQEPNVVLLELQGLRAGSLPVSAHALLEQIAEGLQRQHANLEVLWYRHDGNPTALVRFRGDGPRPAVQLQRLQIKSGKMVISGRSLESSTARADAAPPEAAPFVP